MATAGLEDRERQGKSGIEETEVERNEESLLTAQCLFLVRSKHHIDYCSCVFGLCV